MSVLTLSQFEQIDSLMAALLSVGPFTDCADPRSYIRTSNLLLDVLVDAFGLEYVNDFSDALECATYVVTQALLGQIEVLDEEAA